MNARICVHGFTADRVRFVCMGGPNLLHVVHVVHELKAIAARDAHNYGIALCIAIHNISTVQSLDYYNNTVIAIIK